MDSIFVTPGSQLTDRWSQAFPDALAVSSAAELTEHIAESTALIWLDISSLGKVNLFQEIEKAVALGLPVVIMTTMPAEAEAFQVLSAGGAGYCHAQAAPEQLREIAMVVQHKGIWMPPELMQRLLKVSRRVVPPVTTAGSQLDNLTARELAVAQQIAVGATNREISGRLDITERTVKAHLSSIFEKLGVRDRVQLALAMNNIETTTVT